jgi:hypothetical protein
MAIDIYKLVKDRPTERLYSITEAALDALAPALQLFHRRTGLTIDPYKDQKFSSGLAPLIAALTESMPSEPKKAAVYKDLVEVLEAAERDSTALLFVGD